jgi:hypothetical protein
MHRLVRTTIAALIVSAAVSGTALAQDLRSPDARDGARQVGGASGVQILNGRDQLPAYTQFDLRSPDARAATSDRVRTYTPDAVQSPRRPVVVSRENGFSWGDAGIGAAGMLALVAVFSGTLLILSQRRRQRSFKIATR